MIVDLRDYTTQPAKRDLLIERCERLFFPEQARLGATFWGSFTDLDDPNRFIWLRAMPDLPTRKRVLTEFYTDGEMWKANRAQVNEWIADSDNVLLVRPLTPRPSSSIAHSTMSMYTYLEKQPLSAPRAQVLRDQVAKTVAQAGGRLVMTFATDPSPNEYPRHPIREGEHGLIWFAGCPNDRPQPIEGLAYRRLRPTDHSQLR